MTLCPTCGGSSTTLSRGAHELATRTAGLGSGEVSRRTGVSMRQIDRWAREGIVEPTVRGRGQGFPHRWSQHDVLRIRALGQLATVFFGGGAGGDGKGANYVAFRVAAEATALMDLSHGWLLVAGTRVRWVETADELAEAIRSLGVACIVVGLGGESTEIAA